MTELSKLNFVSAVEVQSLVKDFGEKQDSKAGLQKEVKEFKPADIITAEGEFKLKDVPEEGDGVSADDIQKVTDDNTFNEKWVNMSEALFKLESTLTTINAIEKDSDKLAAFEKDINALEQLKADENNSEEVVTAYNARLTAIKGYYTPATPEDTTAGTPATAAVLDITGSESADDIKKAEEIRAEFSKAKEAFDANSKKEAELTTLDTDLAKLVSDIAKYAYLENDGERSEVTAEQLTEVLKNAEPKDAKDAKEDEKLTDDQKTVAAQKAFVNAASTAQWGTAKTVFSNYNWATYGATAAGTAGAFFLMPINPVAAFAAAMVGAYGAGKVAATFVHHYRNTLESNKEAYKDAGMLKTAGLNIKSFFICLGTQFKAGSIAPTGENFKDIKFATVNNKSAMSVLPNSLKNTTFQVDLTISAIAALVVVFVPAVASLGTLAKLAILTAPVALTSNFAASVRPKMVGVTVPGAAPSAASANEVSTAVKPANTKAANAEAKENRETVETSLAATL